MKQIHKTNLLNAIGQIESTKRTFDQDKDPQIRMPGLNL